MQRPSLLTGADPRVHHGIRNPRVREAQRVTQLVRDGAGQVHRVRGRARRRAEPMVPVQQNLDR